MTIFVKKIDTLPPVPNESEENRFAHPQACGREVQEGRHDGTRRRERQTIEDNRLI